MLVYRDKRGTAIFNDTPAPIECGDEDGQSYHCLHITTAEMARTSLFNLPYNVEVICTRLSGWQLVRSKKVIAGEYDAPEKWLILDVGGVEIVNSREEFPAE